ncbi:MAG: YjbH domain-containing protein, partial [Thermodesulfovibrionia bacterium]|nr:YjbH domain-containing protein [Thermodesulfovibrionia bacterium]
MFQKIPYPQYIIFYILLTPYCIFFFVFSPIYASDEPFTYPSNWGGTGLLEIPTARVIRENSFRLGISQIKPYRYYYGVL